MLVSCKLAICTLPEHVYTLPTCEHHLSGVILSDKWRRSSGRARSCSWKFKPISWIWVGCCMPKWAVQTCCTLTHKVNGVELEHTDKDLKIYSKFFAGWWCDMLEDRYCLIDYTTSKFCNFSAVTTTFNRRALKNYCDHKPIKVLFKL